MLDENLLSQFLVRAKLQTYAGDGQRALPSRPRSKDFHYREGHLLYIDSYLGSFDFIGEELVWRDGVPIWGMNYFGRMLVTSIPDGFLHCLKGALQKVVADAPFRGPEEHQAASLTYRCRWSGGTQAFSGEEVILEGETRIYQLAFHGGSLR